MRSLLLTASTLIFTIFSFTACDPSENASSSGTLEVVLTDAPAAYESVRIDIEEVLVHADSDADDDEDGWRTINNQPVEIDLLNLTNGTTEILGEAELESGTYNQIRLVLGEDNEITVNGETVPLTTPSAQQSGLKLNIDATIESNSTYTLLLDFDASRSIVSAGNSGMYILKPVIRTVNLAESGAIEGDIEPINAQPWVYAIAEQDTVAGTQATADGDFLLIGLTSGTYDLAITPSDETLDAVSLTDITIVAPDTTSVGTINLQGTE